MSLASLIVERRMDLPPTVGLDVANKVLGMGRTAGYALAKRGDYPVRLLPGGSGYRVSRYDLYRHLGVAPEAMPQSAE